jgi:outer membrane protein OmpA-like peptidoglycan-associated protein
MRPTPIKILFVIIGIYIVCLQSQAQNISEPVALAMAETGAYSIIERSDWRRYNNGRYAGLVRQEVRASILPQEAEKNNGISNSTFLYQGNFFVLQNTLRDMRQSARAVDEVVPVSFEIRENGTMLIKNDRGFPAMRGFPSFPAQRVTPGSKWRAPGSRAVNPLNPAQPVIMPFTAEYEYRGIENYGDMRVHRLYATYASRYQNIATGADSFTRVQGSHKVDILIRVEDGLPVFMRDDLDETYTTVDGSTVQFKGFTLTFGEGIVPMNRGEIIASLGTALRIERLPGPAVPVEPVPQPVVSPAAHTVPESGPSEAEDQALAPPPAVNTVLRDSAIDLTPVPEGIRLTIKDIRFVPDSAEFLAAERPRLDLIAEALKQIPERTFLVEGHTAATGRSSGEMELSLERARHMVDELVKRGISADRFIYKGWGGTKPLGDNSTSTGRSVNRRVEITILE